MGWNQGFKIIEDTVLSIYEMGKLDKEMLKAILKPYVNTDVDTGGISFKEAKDGLDLIKVVVKTYFGEIPEEPVKSGNIDAENKDEDIYQDVLWDKFFEVLKEVGIR